MKFYLKSLKNYDYLNEMIEKNSKIVKKKHTWDNRVSLVLKFIGIYKVKIK